MLQPALEPRGGFSFENCQRNASLERLLPELRAPHARKTGTTIAGLVFRDGVILGADTRATNDSVVADKNCEKIHFIAPKIYCCGAGVAADTQMTTRMAASNMELHALSTGREPRVATVTRVLRQTLFRYRGHVGASLIVGGVDVKGPQLYSVHPHGSYSRLPFAALGSGQDAAMAMLEDRFQPNMTAPRKHHPIKSVDSGARQMKLWAQPHHILVGVTISEHLVRVKITVMMSVRIHNLPEPPSGHMALAGLVTGRYSTSQKHPWVLSRLP
ncbi:proteasome subunit beta type-10 isoform X3 [Loxodonta africana]|uniref:proteasome subunit beta type-10 isoform X3 n=1 Tax=Loxodonta africana TaxID=9785 RepID=UPI0030CF3A92